MSSSSKVKIRPLTINDLELSETGPVWVLNTTKAPRRGQLVIGFTSTGGRAGQVVVPLTWIPINLTQQASRKQLLDSNEFRNSVNMGHLNLLHPEQIPQYEVMAGYKEEARKVADFRLNSINNEVSELIRESSDKVDKNDSEGVSPPVFALINTMDKEQETAVLNTLRNMGSLTRNEWRRVYSRAKELRYSQVKEYAKAEKNALKK